MTIRQAVPERHPIDAAPEPPEGFDPARFPIIGLHVYGLGAPIVERRRDLERDSEMRAA